MQMQWPVVASNSAAFGSDFAIFPFFRGVIIYDRDTSTSEKEVCMDWIKCSGPWTITAHSISQTLTQIFVAEKQSKWMLTRVEL